MNKERIEIIIDKFYTNVQKVLNELIEEIYKEKK